MANATVRTTTVSRQVVTTVEDEVYNGITLDLDPTEAEYVFAMLGVSAGAVPYGIYSKVRAALLRAGVNVATLDESTAEIVEESGAVRIFNAEGQEY